MLGVPLGSNEEISRKAYRRLISAWHPDRNESSEAHEQTQKINVAFDTLEQAGFKVEQFEYDRSFQFYEPPPNYGARSHHDFYYEEPVKTARDINRKVKLSVEDAAFGSIHVLKGKTSDVCRTCQGTKRSGKTVKCRYCNGRGYVDSESFYSTYRQCPRCNGHGDLYVNCPACEGKGTTSGKGYSFKVNIPPGVRNGNVLVARGVGGLGSDGKTRSHAKITIEIQAHPIFSFTDDGHLRIVYPVLLTELMRAERVMVPTLYGPQPLTLSPLQIHYVIPGQGFPNRSGEPGDLHVALDVALPNTLDPALALHWKDLEKQYFWRDDKLFAKSRKRRDELLLYRVRHGDAGDSSNDE